MFISNQWLSASLIFLLDITIFSKFYLVSPNGNLFLKYSERLNSFKKKNYGLQTLTIRSSRLNSSFLPNILYKC